MQVEGAVIGGDHFKGAGLQRVPERLLVTLGTNRRAHDGGGPGESRLVVDRVIEQKVLRASLPVDALAASAGFGDGGKSFLAGDVHDVEGLVGHARQHDGARRRFPFQRTRPRLSVVLGTSLALAHQLVLQLDHHVPVFRVHGDQRVQFAGCLHDFDQLHIVHADGATIGHEGLEGRDAFLLHASAHPFRRLVTPPSDRHVKGVIRYRLARLVVPGGEGFQHVLVATGDDEVDDRRRAPGDARRRSCFKVVRGNRAHEGQLHVNVRVDASREDVLPGSVDDFFTPRTFELCTDLSDGAALDPNVADGGVERSDDRSVLDQDAHGSAWWFGMRVRGCK